MTNPLLDTTGLQPFDRIAPSHVAPAIDELLRECDAALERALGPDVPADYDAMAAVYDVASERLHQAWGTVSHLNSVADTPELRAVYNEALPLITELTTRHASDERLYAKYKRIAGSANAAGLSAPRRKALANALRDFVLSGAELGGEAKARFMQIQERGAELAQRYSEHVLDATDGFSYFATATELEGVPADVLQATRDAAAADGKAGHKLTLHSPVYRPVLQYAASRALRERLYRAYVTRASDLGPPELDNSALMRELLSLRQEEAALLGYPSYADVSLVPKMANAPHQVLGFLRDLGHRARDYAVRDLAQLREFAAREVALPDLQAWDIPFVSEKLKEARFAFSDQEVKEYFTEPKVLAGLFGIIETLFEVRIVADTAPTWHPSVRFYRIERDGVLLAQFYLDLHARPGKRSGAWMADSRSRWLRPGGALQTPIAHLVCNFASPVGDKPALLTHNDLVTLFHEFGHGLHHMLTQIDDLAVAGISGVEWDAVELPSQFMENFCWEWSVLQRLSSHVQTGAPLPRALFDKMIEAKNFQSGLQTLRQVEFGVYDMRAHGEPGAETRLALLEQEVRAEVAVLIPPPYFRSAHSFSHIFAGGYSAGYYSYKWAEVLSADAWSAFEENGVFDIETGRRYRREILEAGGSRPALESFTAFRGRAPTIDALLRHQGMA